MLRFFSYMLYYDADFSFMVLQITKSQVRSWFASFATIFIFFPVKWCESLNTWRLRNHAWTCNPLRSTVLQVTSDVPKKLTESHTLRWRKDDRAMAWREGQHEHFKKCLHSPATNLKRNPGISNSEASPRLFWLLAWAGLFRTHP